MNSVTKHTIRLSGTGVLTLRQGCSGNAPSLTLPAHDTVVEGPPVTVTRTQFLIHVLSLPWPLNSTDFNVSALPDLPPLSPFPLRDLTARLQPLQLHAQTPPSASHWWIAGAGILGVLLVVVAAGVGLLYILRYARRAIGRRWPSG